MESDSNSTKNRQKRPFHAGITTFSSPSFQRAGSFRYGVAALPAYIFHLPLTAYPMSPSAAVEQLMPGGFRAAFATAAPEHGPLDAVFEAAASQFPNLQPSAGPGFAAQYSPQIETPMLHTTDEHQYWQYWTAGRDSIENDLDFSQAGTVAPPTLLLSPFYPAAGLQNSQYETAARDNNGNEFDLPAQTSFAPCTYVNDACQDATDDMAASDRFIESVHSASNSSFDTDHRPVSPNKGTHLPFNNTYQSNSTTYDTFIPLDELSPKPSLDPDTSCSPASSSPFDLSSPRPSPSNTLSPNSTRHPCQHCTKDFARLGDVKRHERIHFPERHRKHPCWQPDCDRKGRKAFTRRDKLLEHLRRVHKLEEDELGI